MVESSDVEHVDDIEDLGLLPEVSRLVTSKTRGSFLVTQRNNNPTEKVEADSIIPGTQKVYVKTWGCAHNSSDSEYMAGLLNEVGYTITDDSSLADVWLLNSCTVKNPAEDHFRNAIEEGQNKGKYVIVAGCVSQASPKTPYLKGLSIVGVQQIDRVVEVVEEALKASLQATSVVIKGVWTHATTAAMAVTAKAGLHLVPQRNRTGSPEPAHPNPCRPYPSPCRRTVVRLGKMRTMQSNRVTAHLCQNGVDTIPQGQTTHCTTTLRGFLYQSRWTLAKSKVKNQKISNNSTSKVTQCQIPTVYHSKGLKVVKTVCRPVNNWARARVQLFQTKLVHSVRIAVILNICFRL